MNCPACQSPNITNHSRVGRPARCRYCGFRWIYPGSPADEDALRRQVAEFQERQKQELQSATHFRGRRRYHAPFDPDTRRTP